MLKSTMSISAASVKVLIGKAFVHYTFEFPPKFFIFATKMLGPNYLITLTRGLHVIEDQNVKTC